MLEVSSAGAYFTTNYFSSEAPGTCLSGAGIQHHGTSERVRDGDAAAANGCEGGVGGTPNRCTRPRPDGFIRRQTRQNVTAPGFIPVTPAHRFILRL